MIHGAVCGVGRSFLDIFGKVFSLAAGIGETGSDTESGIHILFKELEIVEGGVESAMCTGVEPVSTQETTEEGSGESSVS